VSAPVAIQIGKDEGAHVSLLSSQVIAKPNLNLNALGFGFGTGMGSRVPIPSGVVMGATIASETIFHHK
jgi:hypothetical protein